MATLIQTIEADLSAAWGAIVNEEQKVVGIVEADAVVLWNDFKSTFTSLLPAEYAVFKDIAAQAFKDVASGDWADLETAVLNQAEAAGLKFISALGSATIQALLAMIKASGL